MSEQKTQQLLDLCGIPAEYEDYREQLVTLPLAVREKTLTAMGFDARPEAIDRTLQTLTAQNAIQALPDVLVARDGEAISFSVKQPETTTLTSVLLCVTTEQGEASATPLAEALLQEPQTFTSQGKTYWSATANIAADLPPGQHHVTLATQQDRETTPNAVNDLKTIASVALFVTPKTCFEPSPLLANEKLFGIAVQLYTLRSQRNWGMGDFTDLNNLVRQAAEQGINIVGLNPLHALFPANPYHYSPYSPSNRAFINVLYIDPERVPEFQECQATQERVYSESFQRHLASLRDAERLDYVGVAQAKLEVMEALFVRFQDHELPNDSPRANAFREFVKAQGKPLFEHALYEALYEHFRAEDANMWGWPVWPEAYRDPASAEVTLFAQQHQDRVEYYQYLQWCAMEQLQAAQQSAISAGMSVGIYLDLAVGVDQAGSEAWSNQSLYCLNASVGAPPDALARDGQDWGFPPLDPRAMKRSAYRLFIQNLRASMSCAGAVRYDHAVALLRLWWIPRGQSATEGAYVNYDLQELLGVIALESWRNKCMVIGEDLGTVPDVLTETMLENHLYSYKVLYFEKYKKGGMLPGNAYPKHALATVTTHDLPTLASWWDESDLDVREELNLLGDSEMIKEIRAGRAEDKQYLLDVLNEHGLIGKMLAADVPEMTADLNDAVHLFLAGSNAGVMISQIEDWLGMLEPINIPGTFDEYPNWTRKLTHTLEELFKLPRVAGLCQKIRQLR